MTWLGSRSFATQQIVVGRECYFPAITCDENDGIHVAYKNEATIYYGSLVGGSWATEYVKSVGSFHESCLDIVIDPNTKQPVISYIWPYDEDGGYVCVSDRNKDGTWNFVNQSGYNFDLFANVEFDANNELVLSTFERSSTNPATGFFVDFWREGAMAPYYWHKTTFSTAYLYQTWRATPTLITATITPGNFIPDSTLDKAGVSKFIFYDNALGLIPDVYYDTATTGYINYTFMKDPTTHITYIYTGSTYGLTDRFTKMTSNATVRNRYCGIHMGINEDDTYGRETEMLFCVSALDEETEYFQVYSASFQWKGGIDYTGGAGVVPNYSDGGGGAVQNYDSIPISTHKKNRYNGLLSLAFSVVGCDSFYYPNEFHIAQCILGHYNSEYVMNSRIYPQTEGSPLWHPHHYDICVTGSVGSFCFHVVYYDSYSNTLNYIYNDCCPKISLDTPLTIHYCDGKLYGTFTKQPAVGNEIKVYVGDDGKLYGQRGCPNPFVGDPVAVFVGNDGKKYMQKSQ